MSPTSSRPPLIGLHHVAIQTPKFEAERAFYTDVMGMQVEWEPDSDNVYLTSGADNLAIHRVECDSEDQQRLDHLGFVVPAPSDVDAWYEYLVTRRVEIVEPPRTHRDGARSFYCVDPSNIKVQVIYHPPLSAKSN